MHGPTCIVWANLTPFSLKDKEVAKAAEAAAKVGLGRTVASEIEAPNLV
jgi:hypothetical protein